MMVRRRQLMASTAGIPLISVLSGCSDIFGNNKTPLSILLENTSSEEQRFQVTVTGGGEDGYTNSTTIPAGSDTYLEKVKKYNRNAESEINVEVVVADEIENSKSYEITGTGFYIISTFDGESVQIDGGHGDS